MEGVLVFEPPDGRDPAGRVHVAGPQEERDGVVAQRCRRCGALVRHVDLTLYVGYDHSAATRSMLREGGWPAGGWVYVEHNAGGLPRWSCTADPGDAALLCVPPAAG